ncbi:MAG: hypothetical protein H6658_04735 [Ardenticatenaceae bacterium]|nr:hypothetical protein [Ardenticatenaceae bacterium]
MQTRKRPLPQLLAWVESGAAAHLAAVRKAQADSPQLAAEARAPACCDLAALSSYRLALYAAVKQAARKAQPLAKRRPV